MKMTAEKLRDIFYSGIYGFAGYDDLIIKLRFLLDHGYLKCKSIVIAEKSEYHQLCDDQDSFVTNMYEASGGSIGHVALKLLAQKYLHKFGTEADFEQLFCGYYPDVISRDKLTVIECGHTDNLDKILTYFTQGGVVEVIQLPYPTADSEKVFAYSFTANPELEAFLKAESDSNKNNILSILNRKRYD